MSTPRKRSPPEDVSWTSDQLRKSPTSSCPTAISPSKPVRMVPIGYRIPHSQQDFKFRLEAVLQRMRNKKAIVMQRWWRRILAAERSARHQRVVRRLAFLNIQAAMIQRWWRNVKLGKARKRIRKETFSDKLTHALLRIERGSRRSALHPQLRSVWKEVTSKSPSKELRERNRQAIESRAASRPSSRLSVATTQSQRNHKPTDGRFTPNHLVARETCLHQGACWNDSPLLKQPLWYEVPRDPNLMKRKPLDLINKRATRRGPTPDL